jgi:hypothetical protein
MENEWIWFSLLLRSNLGSKMICRTDLIIFLGASLNAGLSLKNIFGSNGGAVDVNSRGRFDSSDLELALQNLKFSSPSWI